MSDNPAESILQETKADSPSQAAPAATRRVPLKPKYIQMLGGAMVLAGTLMTWVVLSEEYSRRGIDVIADITGLPLFLGGPLIVLAALLPSRTPRARGSRLAAVLGLLAFLYAGYEAIMIGRLPSASVGVGVWVCLLGSLLAMAGGWPKNPDVQPQPATAARLTKTLDVPVVERTEATGTSATATQATAKDLMNPKYIQALGGALMVVGSFMPWVFISAQYSLTGVSLGVLAGLPILLGGALIVLAALFTSDAPGARGRWTAALLGLLALLYMGLYIYGERNSYTFGVGVWMCLAGSLLAFAGGRVKLKALALPLGIIVLATLLGCFVPYVIVKIQENSYQKMFSFPDKAAEILSGDYEGLYISTVEGKVLFCDVSTKPTPCNEIALENVPTTPTSQPGQRPCLHPFSPPPAPGKVIATYEYCAQYADGLAQTVWVILDNGNVWSWKVDCNMMGCAYDPGLRMVLGSIVGFLVGVVIVAVLRSRWKNQGGQFVETHAPAVLPEKDVWECGVCGAVVDANATACPACGTQFEN